MGGYALYVWGSFAVTAVLMAIEVWQARRQRTDALQSLRREHDLQASDAARAAHSKELS
jgi:heme exporter protein D